MLRSSVMLAVFAALVVSAGCQSGGPVTPAKYGIMMSEKDLGNHDEYCRLIEMVLPEVRRVRAEQAAAPPRKEEPPPSREDPAQEADSFAIAAEITTDALGVAEQAVARWEFYVRLALTGLNPKSAEGEMAAHRVGKDWEKSVKRLRSATREKDVDDKLEEAGKCLAALGELARSLDAAFGYLEQRPEATSGEREVLSCLREDLREGRQAFAELHGHISAELAAMEARGERGESTGSRLLAIAGGFSSYAPGGRYIRTGAAVVRGGGHPVRATHVATRVNVHRVRRVCSGYTHVAQRYTQVVRGCRPYGTGVNVGVLVNRGGGGTAVGVGVNVRR